MCSKAIYRSKNFLSFFFNEKKYLDYLQNGGAYMAQKYKIEKQLVSSEPKLSVSKTLIDEFGAVDTKYAERLNDLTEKKKTLQSATPDFTYEAIDILKDFKQDSLNTIEGDYMADLQKINQNIAKNSEKNAKNAQNVNDNAEKSKNDLLKKALNSGWENSSILDNGIENIDRETNKQLSLLEKQSSLDSSANSLKKTLLEIEKENALKNFDIKYASKLDKQIASLENQFKLTEDGKQISKQIANVNDAISDVEDQKRMEKTKSLLGYVNGLKKQEGLDFLSQNRDELINEVGLSWYNSVHGWLKARS